MALWVPTDLTKSSGVEVLSQWGVAGYEHPFDRSKHVIFQSAKSDGTAINELYCGLDGKWHFTDLTSDAGAPLIESLGLSAYVDSDQFNPYQHVIYNGFGDRRIFEIYWQSGDKNTNDLNSSSSSPPMLIPFAPEGYDFGQQNIFFSAVPGGVCRLLRFDDSWSFQNLYLTAKKIGSLGAANAECGPSAFMTTDLPSSINVVYRGSDGTVYLLRLLENEESWTIQSLTTSSPPAVLASGPPIGASINPRLVAVHYCGIDGHLQQISWIGQNTGILSYYNLTKPLGAPPVNPLARPNSYVFPADQSTHVVYHGVDGHLHELSSTNGYDWTWLDMSVDAGLTDDQAPLAVVARPNLVPNKAAFVFTEQLTQHVVYTSVANRVIELKRSPPRKRPRR